MIYKYDGKAVEELFLSYKNDKEPYLTQQKTFPEEEDKSRVRRLLKEIFFPNYWNASEIANEKEKLKEKISELGQIFFEGIKAYSSDGTQEKDVKGIVDAVINKLADVRESLKTDAHAAFAGDPAAGDYTQIIRSYPGFLAILVHRAVHELYLQGAKGYAREIQEKLAHSMTGIDIHPGAKIGLHFFIDHGTGVVIGETAEIGDHVRLYQGVTLGVLHFEKEEEGILKKGYKRHPTIKSHVVIGAGANILGPITIGDHVNIGAGSRIQEDVPSHTTIYKELPKHIRRERKKVS